MQKKQAELINKTVTQVKARLQEAAQKAQATVEPELTSVSIEPGEGQTVVKLMLSSEVPYHLITDASDQLISLALKGVVLSAQLPKPLGKVITELSENKTNDSLVVNFFVKPGTVLQAVKHYRLPSNAYQLQLIFKPDVITTQAKSIIQAPVEQTSNTVIEKTPVKLSQNEQRALAYQQVLNALGDNDVASAPSFL